MLFATSRLCRWCPETSPGTNLPFSNPNRRKFAEKPAQSSFTRRTWSKISSGTHLTHQSRSKTGTFLRRHPVDDFPRSKKSPFTSDHEKCGLDVVWNGRARDLNQRLERLGLPVRVANMTSVWTTFYTQPGCYNWMFQYYLRAEGITMSWIGTGRFIFSHDLNERDFDEIADRFVAAAQAMQRDGWWWKNASMTNKTIKRRIMKELFSASLWGSPSDQTTGPSEAIPAPCGISS